MNILAYKAEQEGNLVRFQCSDGRVQSNFNDYLEAIVYLLQPCDFAVVWNVDKFADAFCSLIPKNIAKELKENGKAFLPMPYHQKLYYQVGRVFSITWGAGREVNFYPLSRYYGFEVIDVNELKELANRVIEAYGYLGIIPTKLSSPVSAYSQILNEIDFPRACDLPESAFSMLNKCSEKAWVEWREVYKLGHWNGNEVIDADLTAAYPYLMSKLPDLRGARFFESDTMPEYYSWGELEGELTITKDVTPFLYTGTWEDSITSDQLWLINRWGLGEFKLKHGWFFQLPKYYKYPFKETMGKLYQARQNDNLLVKNISKAIAVGIGGKLAQRYDDGELGSDYNSIYSRMITSRCSTKVADFIYRNSISWDVISVLVDGVLFENNGIEIKLAGDGMGEWRTSEPSPFLVASLLYQWGNTKRPNKQNYDEIIESIRINPKNSIIGNDVDLNLLEYDRVFDELPKCGGDLITKRYNSRPQQKEIQVIL